MATITVVGTNTTAVAPSGSKIIALYPSKEHTTVSALSSKIRNDIVSGDLPDNLSATKIADGTVGNTEFQYLANVSSDIQAQIDGISGGGVTDGDKGDITVSGSGSTWTIDNDVVTFSKTQNIATDRLLGRNTAGSGNIEELTASTVKNMLSLDSVENTALSTWAGSSNITTLGTITTGTWQGTAIDSAYLGAHTHAASDITSGTFANARIAESNVTQHESALSITESQISDLGSYITASSTDTLTNKTIDGDSNTLSNLDIGNEVDWASASDVTDRTGAPASGDKLLLFEAGVGLRKIDWDDLPSGGSGGDNISIDGSAVTDPDFVSTGDIDFVDTSNTITANINAGSVDTTELADEATTFAKMQHIATNRILGRDTAGTGDIEALTGATVRDLISLGTTDSPQFNALNLGHATDTTITRTSAGVIAVEGTQVALFGDNISEFTNDSGYITATLTQEQVEDYVGAMFTGNTETLITATYQDADGTIDLVVDDDLSNYDNTTSGFVSSGDNISVLTNNSGYITASSTDTLTNKTINGNNNTISNLAIGSEVTGASTDLTDTADITYNTDTNVSGNSWVLDEDDMSSDSATKVPTQQSVKAYVDNNAGGGSVTTLDNFELQGTQVTGKVSSRRATQGATLSKFSVYLETAPTGSSFTVDLYVGGVNVATATVSASSNSGTTTTFSDSTLTEGDLVEYDITQVGSTVAGADLTIGLNVS